jgi:transposase
VLTPGLGRTKTGRLWAYVRDDRPFCGDAAPAVVYFYSPDRGGAHPAAHMATFIGFLQADGYAGYVVPEFNLCCPGSRWPWGADV